MVRWADRLEAVILWLIIKWVKWVNWMQSMSDIVERLRETASCADYVVDREIAAEAADTITRLTAENEKLREAVLCAALMLSERGLSSAEKCQMAYDYLSEIHPAIPGDNHE